MNDIIKSVTVPLILPVEVNGKVYSELNFRRMKARDALSGEGETDETKAGFALFATLADVPLDVILELDMEDLAEVGAKVAPLMGKRAQAMLKKKQRLLSPGEI